MPTMTDFDLPKSIGDSPCHYCTRRTAVPNCHNPDRCKDWKEYTERRGPRRINKAREVYEYQRASKLTYFKSHGKKGKR